MFAFWSSWTRTLHAHTISTSLRDFMGSTMIALLSISPSTMMYVCPRFDCLVAETCQAPVIGPDISVFYLLPSQRCCRMAFFKRGFGGPDIFLLLVHVALGGFFCLGVVLVDVLFSEEWPPNKITCPGCLAPCGFDGIAANGVHSLYCLLNGR